MRTRPGIVGMADNMRFDPAELKIKRRDTVRFMVRNHGKVLHEIVIGKIIVNQRRDT